MRRSVLRSRPRAGADGRRRAAGWSDGRPGHLAQADTQPLRAWADGDVDADLFISSGYVGVVVGPDGTAHAQVVSGSPCGL